VKGTFLCRLSLLSGGQEERLALEGSKKFTFTFTVNK